MYRFFAGEIAEKSAASTSTLKNQCIDIETNSNLTKSLCAESEEKEANTVTSVLNRTFDKETSDLNVVANMSSHLDEQASGDGALNLSPEEMEDFLLQNDDDENEFGNGITEELNEDSLLAEPNEIEHENVASFTDSVQANEFVPINLLNASTINATQTESINESNVVSTNDISDLPQNSTVVEQNVQPQLEDVNEEPCVRKHIDYGHDCTDDVHAPQLRTVPLEFNQLREVVELPCIQKHFDYGHNCDNENNGNISGEHPIGNDDREIAQEQVEQIIDESVAQASTNASISNEIECSSSDGTGMNNTQTQQTLNVSQLANAQIEIVDDDNETTEANVTTKFKRLSDEYGLNISNAETIHDINVSVNNATRNFDRLFDDDQLEEPADELASADLPEQIANEINADESLDEIPGTQMERANQTIQHTENMDISVKEITIAKEPRKTLYNVESMDMSPESAHSSPRVSKSVAGKETIAFELGNKPAENTESMDISPDITDKIEQCFNIDTSTQHVSNVEEINESVHIDEALTGMPTDEQADDRIEDKVYNNSWKEEMPEPQLNASEIIGEPTKDNQHELTELLPQADNSNEEIQEGPQDVSEVGPELSPADSSFCEIPETQQIEVMEEVQQVEEKEVLNHLQAQQNETDVVQEIPITDDSIFEIPETQQLNDANESILDQSINTNVTVDSGCASQITQNTDEHQANGSADDQNINTAFQEESFLVADTEEVINTSVATEQSSVVNENDTNFIKPMQSLSTSSFVKPIQTTEIMEVSSAVEQTAVELQATEFGSDEIHDSAPAAQQLSIINMDSSFVRPAQLNSAESFAGEAEESFFFMETDSIAQNPIARRESMSILKDSTVSRVQPFNLLESDIMEAAEESAESNEETTEDTNKSLTTEIASNTVSEIIQLATGENVTKEEIQTEKSVFDENSSNVYEQHELSAEDAELPPLIYDESSNDSDAHQLEPACIEEKELTPIGKFADQKLFQNKEFLNSDFS